MNDDELILMLYGESEPNDSEPMATPMIDLYTFIYAGADGNNVGLDGD